MPSVGVVSRKAASNQKTIKQLSCPIDEEDTLSLAWSSEGLRNSLLQQAEKATKRLVKQGAEAIMLFGSVARGDVSRTSDVDLLVLQKHDNSTPLPVVYNDLPRVEITPVPFKKLLDPSIDWGFLKKALNDGELIYDESGMFSQAAENLPQAAPASYKQWLADTSRNAEEKIQQYSFTTREEYANCYRLVTHSIIGLLSLGEAPYKNRHEAYNLFSQQHPESESATIIAKLEPVYLWQKGKMKRGTDINLLWSDKEKFRQAALDIIRQCRFEIARGS